MSYAKMMKWNRKHPKGISYKRGNMGFNSSGITSKEIDVRTAKYLDEIKAKTLEERKAIWQQYSDCIALDLGSWAWEWCVFQRNFVFNNEVN